MHLYRLYLFADDTQSQISYAVSALRMTSRFYRTEKLVDVADILFWSTDHCRLLECFFFLECHVSLALSEMICRMPLQLASCMFTFQKVKFVKPMHAEIGESPRLRIWDCALPNPAVYWHTVLYLYYIFIPSSFYTVRVRRKTVGKACIALHCNRNRISRRGKSAPEDFGTF